MISLNAAECAEILSGELRSCDPLTVIHGVSIDSRSIAPGHAFLAIRGERYDGSDFCAEAVARGAVAVITDRVIEGVPLILSNHDGVASLQRLAAWNRSKIATSCVIGITGSAGKTLTKDMVAAVLQSAGAVVSSRESANNEVGVPLTLLQADEKTDYVVVELGARHVGDISFLCEIAKPTVAVVTNVGMAHIEIFGSIEQTQVAKGEIVRDLTSENYAILNFDDPRVMAMSSTTKAKTLTFGSSEQADLTFSNVEVKPDGHTVFTLSGSLPDRATATAQVSLPMAGSHLAANAAAAALVGLLTGATLAEVALALGEMNSISPHRARVIEVGGVTIIDDSYNANPESMKAALRLLAEVAGNRRKVAVLGDMLELGSHGHREHQDIGALADSLDISVLICVGEMARQYSTKSLNAKWVADAEAAKEITLQELKAGDVILVKASRAIGLESVVDFLNAELTLVAKNESAVSA